MLTTYSFMYRGEHLDYIFLLCDTTKCLYNQALNMVLTKLNTDGKWIFYNELDPLINKDPEKSIYYKRLPSGSAQHCLKQLDTDIKSYIHAIKDWSKNKSKYKNKPNLPKEKTHPNQIIYPTISYSKLKKGYLLLDRNHFIKIPQYEKYKEQLKRSKMFRIIPRNGCVEFYITYEQDEIENQNSNIAMFDLGISNLVTSVISDGTTTIYNGRGIKSINRHYNKRISYYKSKLKKTNNKNKSKRITKLYDKRNKRIKHDLHAITRRIVNDLKSRKVKEVVIGYNTNWKQKTNLGRRNNQNFNFTPHRDLIHMLDYKCMLSGIKLTLHEESYTSLCDALVLESIRKHDSYRGKRIKRGLFQSSIGRFINADVNGALNIGRKVFGDAPIKELFDRGFRFNPVRCNVL